MINETRLGRLVTERIEMHSNDMYDSYYVIDYDEELQKDEDDIVIHNNTVAPRVDVM
jgi:predicted DNA-binding protein